MQINIVNESDVTLSKVAWDFSRPRKQSVTELEEVLPVDAPVNDFPSLVLQIESTIIEREIIASLRDHVMWAQSSRAEDMLKFIVPHWIYEEYSEVFERMRTSMQYQKDNGDRQDEYRLHTPILSNTKYMIRLSMRTTAKLAMHFRRLSMDCINPYTQLFENASLDLWEVLRRFTGVNSFELLYNYTPINLNPPVSVEGSGRVGDFIIITQTMPFSLRTHLIRHRTLQVVDNLRYFIDYNHIGATIGDEIVTQICGSTEMWRAIITKRSCWLAHNAMWATIINQVQEQLGTQSLPCNNGKCPYHTDAELRYTDADPNPPCPIHAKMHSVSVTPGEIDAMNDLILKDQRSITFWGEKVKTL